MTELDETDRIDFISLNDLLDLTTIDFLTHSTKKSIPLSDISASKL